MVRCDYRNSVINSVGILRVVTEKHLCLSFDIVVSDDSQRAYMYNS